MIKFTVNNKTNWETKDLRKLCRAVIKHIGTRRHRITVEYSKKTSYDCYHGYAYINSIGVTMFVPRETRRTIKAGDNGKSMTVIESIKFEPEKFAQVLEHEIYHNMGLKHDEMSKEVLYCKQDCGYVKNLKVSVKTIKEKKPRNLQKERYEKALKNAKLYTSKVKRYTNLLKKWNSKVKYYEKVISK